MTVITEIQKYFRCVHYSVSVKLIFMKLKKTAYFIHCIKLSESMYTNINFPAVFYVNGDKIAYMCLILLTIIQLIA